MDLLIKYSKTTVSILCMLVLLWACDKESEEPKYRYMFGLTSAINSNNVEIEAIETAYCDAFKKADLKFGSQFFAMGTSKEAILKACNEAEYAILTSSIAFDGKYTYEIKYAGKSIYYKFFGIR